MLGDSPKCWTNSRAARLARSLTGVQGGSASSVVSGGGGGTGTGIDDGVASLVRVGRRTGARSRFRHHPQDFSFCRTRSMLAKAKRKAPPWDRLRQALEEGCPLQPSLRSVAEPSLRLRSSSPTPPPAEVCAPRVRRIPAVGLRRSRRRASPATLRPPLPTLSEDAEDLPDEPVAVTGEPLASLSDQPPLRRCICCGLDGERCINLVQPNGVDPHRSGRWCAWCTPPEGDAKCGCLCGNCEVHDYNTEVVLGQRRVRLRLPVDPVDDRSGCRLAWWPTTGTNCRCSADPGQRHPTTCTPPPSTLTAT